MKLRQLVVKRREVAPCEWAANPNKRIIIVETQVLQYNLDDGNGWQDVPIVSEREAQIEEERREAARHTE